MNTTDILKMFSNPDGWNEFQREPFLYQMSDGKMVAVATDGHRLCLFKEYDLHAVSSKEFHKPNVEKVIIPDQCTGTLSVERLQKALAQVPINKFKECEDCCGSGDVDYEYESLDGHTYYERYECPVCGGTGRFDDEEGEKEFDANYCIKIDGACFMPEHLKPIVDALTAMEIAEVPYIIANNQLKIETGQFIMLLMACLHDFAQEIKY